MKYVICLGFNQEYFWIPYCRGACAIDMAEENTDKFPEGIGLTVSWLWLWFHIFSFCCESLKNTLMRSVSSYAEISENSNIYSCGMIYVISLAEGFLLSIYWVGWYVILFKSHPTWLIWPQISCLQRDFFFLSLEVTVKDIGKWQRLDCQWQTLLFLNPIWSSGKINITACKGIFLLNLHAGPENCSFCQSKLELLPELSSVPPHVLARLDTSSFLSVNSKHCRNACNKDAWHIKLNCINPALLLNCSLP